MKDTLQVIVIILVGFLFVWGMGIVAKSGLDKSEIVDCQKWQQESAQYNGFYIVQWQADQCKAHNIIINAPVK